MRNRSASKFGTNVAIPTRRCNVQPHGNDEDQTYVEHFQGRGTRHPDETCHHAEKQTQGICCYQLMPFDQLRNRRCTNGVQDASRQ